MFSHGWPSISKPHKTSVFSLYFTYIFPFFHIFPKTFEHVRAFSSVWLWASPWMTRMAPKCAKADAGRLPRKPHLDILLQPDRCILVPLLSSLLTWFSFRQEIFTWPSAIVPVKREQSMGACGCTRSQDVTRHTVSSFPGFPSYCDFSTVSLSAPSP